MENKQFTLLPEWAEQEAVILAWPHANTDWLDTLFEVRDTYLEIIDAINLTNTPVILLCPENELESLKKRFAETNKVLIIKTNYNDTWVRDYCFLSASFNDQIYPINFTFNAWGNKYDSSLDDSVNTQLAPILQQKLVNVDMVLEGGAIEIDENHHLLSSLSCLSHKDRNPNLSLPEQEALFCKFLGARQISLFKNGKLEGDDTDGHIDTLVRFTPLMGVVAQSAKNRPKDSHYQSLMTLEKEVQKSLPVHKLYSLPLANVKNAEGKRLAASYANFLIVNRQVIMPTYGVIEDEEAISTIQQAYPNYRIVAVNCTSLIQQNGSLHCITMQVPCDTIKPEIIHQARKGVSIL